MSTVNRQTEKTGSFERTIFIIDDDDAVRDSIVALLEINEREVASYASAQEFLAEFQGLAYCLLLDVEMPEMTGPDLVRRLADRAQLPPTVLLTANEEDPATLATLTYGVQLILAKPVAETVLLEAIDAAAAAHKGNPL